jgi:hypothetical protein
MCTCLTSLHVYKGREEPDEAIPVYTTDEDSSRVIMPLIIIWSPAS